ncbi:MAG: L-rhamnose mutarotase [Bacteroidales bacterium]|nr:L-rhamnose mutarotase [Bacteroidales bacterium]
MKTEGYPQQQYAVPTKRYCQTLDLREDPELIATYRKLHSEEHIWKEIVAGIREVGILEMEIYLLGTRLFMIVETPLDFDWDSAMARMATLPRQSEWEALTAKYQVADPSAGSAEKWRLMERIFHLYK